MFDSVYSLPEHMLDLGTANQRESSFPEYIAYAIEMELRFGS